MKGEGNDGGGGGNSSLVIGEHKIPGEVVCVCGVCEQSWVK